MLAYEPDDSFAHRLDPRTKLAVQIGFAIAAISHGSLAALAGLSVFVLAVIGVAGASLRQTLYAYRYALVFLVLAPVLALVEVTPPGLDVDAAITTALASYSVLLILLVSAAYVRSTPVRDSRAAIQRTVPGKPGQLLGVGIALVFRFLPVLSADLRAIRDAVAVRLGTERSALDRTTRIGALGLSRAFERADRLSVAMQARCFSWNPTLPPLAFGRRDVPVLVGALALAVSPLL